VRYYLVRFETVPGYGNDHLGPEIEHLAEQYAGRRGYDTTQEAFRAARGALTDARETWRAQREERGAPRITPPTVRFVVYEPREEP
jgi:hypothetical protein